MCAHASTAAVNPITRATATHGFPAASAGAWYASAGTGATCGLSIMFAPRVHGCPRAAPADWTKSTRPVQSAPDVPPRAQRPDRQPSHPGGGVLHDPVVLPARG